MKKYAKLIDGAIEFAPINYITEEIALFNFGFNEELMLEYGYKPFVEAEKPDYLYIISYEETEEEIREVITRDTEKEAEIAREEAEKQRKMFFNTSLGYVKRIVTMKDGTTRNFLCDILPLLVEGAPILTYALDGTQSKVNVTQQFINECKNQLLVDFYGEEQE